MALRRLQIKGMVCQRCINAVEQQLQAIGVQLDEVELGEVRFSANTTLPDLPLIEQKLRKYGFSILEDPREKLIKSVKQIISEVYNGDFDFPPSFKFSALLASRLNKEYEAISSVFSQVENITLEKFILQYRIEKVKELLVYSDEKLSDLAFRLGFSSVAHVSGQFKLLTGLTPTHFKEIQKAKSITSKMKT